MKLIANTDVELFTKSFFLLIAGVPVACLIISLFFDWGTFRAAGISFSDAPTSIPDHIRTTLVWMPRTVEVLVIGGVVATFVASRFNKNTWSKKVPSPPLPLSKRKSDLFLVVLVILWVLLMDIGWFYYGSDRFPGGAPVFWLTVWFCYSVWILKNRKLNESYDRKYFYLLVTTTLVVLFYHSMGYAVAKQELQDLCASHRLEIRNGNQFTEWEVRIVRSFRDWKLVIPKPEPEPNPFVWIRSDIVQNISGLNAPDFQGIDNLFEKDQCGSENQSG